MFFRPKGEKTKIRGRRKVSAFLVCLVVATLFWFLNALSKNYTAAISFPVQYSNLPVDKVLISELPKKLHLEVNARGFLILAYRFHFLNDTVHIDAGNVSFRNFGDYTEAKLKTSEKVHFIERRLSDDIKIQRVVPEIVYLTFGTKIIRQIPVRLNSDISFEKQHRLKNDIIINPAMVRVEGLEEIVNKIQYVETDSLILKNLNSSLTKELNVILPSEFKSLKLEVPIVSVTVPVEKFTEAVVEVPIEILNLPGNLSMKIFPEKAVITCIVGFSDFDKIKDAMFSASVDYEHIDESNRLKVDIARHPEFVRILRYHPQKVEYIIRKR
jgi:YbbR domain-containing protein